MEEKIFTEKEVKLMLEKQEIELRAKVKDYIEDKATEKAEIRALTIAENYKELSTEMKKFQQDKEMIQYYIQG